MRGDANELAWRIKLVLGLAALGGLTGFLGWLWWLAETAGGSQGWGLPQWFQWLAVLVERGFGSELAVAAGVGAAALSGPALLFMMAPRASGRP